MNDAERGNTKHGPALDEQMEQETRAMVQGHGGTPHVEPFRETEPLPDDSDPAEIERAFGGDLSEGAGTESGEGGRRESHG